MTNEEIATLYDQFKSQGSDRITLEVRRTTRVLEKEPDKSFSAAAMENLFDQIRLFVGARIASRWERTDEAPSLVKIDINVTAA